MQHLINTLQKLRIADTRVQCTSPVHCLGDEVTFERETLIWGRRLSIHAMVHQDLQSASSCGGNF